jgi:hypothetical protein
MGDDYGGKSVGLGSRLQDSLYSLIVRGGGGKKQNKGTVPKDSAQNFSWNHCYFLTGDRF